MIKYGPELFWYPSGRVAAGIPIRVTNMPGGELSTVFDAGGLPIRNPVLTGSDGKLTFWAEPGAYMLEMNGVSIPITLSGGESGTGAPRWVHTQTEPAATWVIDHDLNTYPSVTLVDPDGNDLGRTEVDYPSTDRVVITWGGPISGVAILRG